MLRAVAIKVVAVVCKCMGPQRCMHTGFSNLASAILVRISRSILSPLQVLHEVMHSCHNDCMGSICWCMDTLSWFSWRLHGEGHCHRHFSGAMSELQVAEAALMDVRVDGSLLVHADCVMGSMEAPWEAAAAAIRNPDDIHVSHPDGRQTLYPAGSPQQPGSAAAAHGSGEPLFSNGALHLQASAALSAHLHFHWSLSRCRLR